MANRRLKSGQTNPGSPSDLVICEVLGKGGQETAGWTAHVEDPRSFVCHRVLLVNQGTPPESGQGPGSALSAHPLQRKPAGEQHREKDFLNLLHNSFIFYQILLAIFGKLCTNLFPAITLKECTLRISFCLNRISIFSFSL